jgi:hypothetical protein
MAFLGLVPTRNERKTLVDLFTGENGAGKAIEVGPGLINIRLIQGLAPYAEQRSFFRPILLKRIVMEKQATSLPKAAATGAVDLGMGITKGVLQAIGALFGITGSMAEKAKIVDQMPSGLAGIIAQHPILAGVLGALLVKSMSQPSKPLVSGNFTVADSSQGLYNNDWQRRFVEMQNRPVSVIKTGAAKEQANMLVSPLTYLLMSVDLEKTADEQRSWEMIADQFIQQLQSKEHKEIVKSASRIAPNEVSELSFVVPEIADLEIIKHVLMVTQ